MEVVNGTVSSVSTQRVHFAGIDWLRGFAAFFIVGCHIGLLDRTVLGAKLTHFCDMNVGVLAAISGFLFFRRGISRPNADFGRILEKRIKRLLSMYLIWSLFYLAIRWLTNCVIGGGGFSRRGMYTLVPDQSALCSNRHLHTLQNRAPLAEQYLVYGHMCIRNAILVYCRLWLPWLLHCSSFFVCAAWLESCPMQREVAGLFLWLGVYRDGVPCIPFLPKCVTSTVHA